MNRIEHLLTCLIEECAEVQKEASKALRFGFDDKWKSDLNTLNTAEKIALECIDLSAVISMLQDEKIIEAPNDYADLIRKKKERVKKYMDYAAERKALIDD